MKFKFYNLDGKYLTNIVDGKKAKNINLVQIICKWKQRD